MCVCLCRDVEYKEMLLSQDQSRSRASLSYKNGLTASQDSHKQLKAKTGKIKSKLKVSPYPQVKELMQVCVHMQSVSRL